MSLHATITMVMLMKYDVLGSITKSYTPQLYIYIYKYY